MGLDAQLVAIGPFSEDILSALEYPQQYYAGVGVGDTVITNVFVAPTSVTSRQLAEAFGIGAMDLGRHDFTAIAANCSLLTEVFGEANVSQYVLLVKHGFRFYYLPNG